ncbi:MAG: DUF4350 domain-containing protein [Thermodesulfobacteriota bacterium]|nr:DUF4350 domain-containing protein [Thermodesulfobacteriota bacterium]
MSLRAPWFFCCLLILSGCSTASAEPVALFDQAHGQAFLVEKNGPLDLSGLAGVFAEQGALVRTSSAKISATTLTNIDILIISGPFAPIEDEEIKAIIKFIEQGGRLAVMVHIGPPVIKLLMHLGVSISSAAVYEQNYIIDGNPLDFMVPDLASHPLTNGLDGFNVYGSWALLGNKEHVESVARTSKDSWVDLNRNKILNEKDAKQSFSLVVAGGLGHGQFAVFGDDAIFQNRFLKGGNLLLGRNLARWFCSTPQLI